MRKNSRVPNFRNLGVNLRLLVIVISMAIAAAILLSDNVSGFIQAFTSLLAILFPIVILIMLLLYATQPALTKLNYTVACTVITASTLLITTFVINIAGNLFILDSATSNLRACLLTLIVTLVVLYYFNLQHRAYSPAVAEARLQALQARIRPHFLFNSINAVLSLIRSEPKRAETALEDMADLFRVLMADNRDLVPLAQEIALCKQYLALEKLRLEDRLNINWQIDNMPSDALVPPLLLQPLLENAVYHGIEPLPDGGEIVVQIKSQSKEVHIVISNPCPTQSNHSGNKMALNNIRERLLLHFDLEATLTTNTKNKQHSVHIVIPNVKHNDAK